MATDTSSVTNHFPKPQDGFTTTTSGSISASAATVGLNSTGSYANGDIFVGIIEPGTSGKEQTFTGVVDVSGLQITGVKWTRGTDVAHSAGVTVVDYVSATHLGMVSKGVLVEHNQDGTHDEATITSRTEDTAPASGDYVLTSDVSASNALKKVTLINKLVAMAGFGITNNTWFKWKNSSGTATNAVKLHSDNYLRLSQLPRQDDTTNSTSDNVLIQYGYGVFPAAANSAKVDTITFPVAYDAAPIVLVAYGGDDTAGSSALGQGGVENKAVFSIWAYNVTTTTFASRVQTSDASNWGASDTVFYHWVAIGAKA